LAAAPPVPGRRDACCLVVSPWQASARPEQLTLCRSTRSALPQQGPSRVKAHTVHHMSYDTPLTEGRYLALVLAGFGGPTPCPRELPSGVPDGLRDLSFTTSVVPHRCRYTARVRGFVTYEHWIGRRLALGMPPSPVRPPQAPSSAEAAADGIVRRAMAHPFGRCRVALPLRNFGTPS